MDVTSLGEFTDRLTFVASATATTGGTTAGSATSAPTGSVGGDLEACHKSKLKTFMDALGVSGTPGGSISVSASPAAQKAAADALQAALADPECPGYPKKATYEHTKDGKVFKLRIGVGGSGDLEVEGEADVVVAVGNDGAGTSDGQDATATNEQPGGVALAFGGDGGSGASSGGDGGTGSATVTPVVLPPPANPTPIVTPGQATGIGGNGGVPSPTSGTGGSGGAGSAGAGGGGSVTMSGSVGSPGYHGMGGYAQMDAGTYGTPDPQPN